MAIKTNKSDVIANFVRYYGRQPTLLEDLKTVEYLTTKAPNEVESLLAKNSPITKGLIWSKYQEQQRTPEQPVTPIPGIHYNEPGIGPGEVTPPPITPPTTLSTTPPMTGLDEASRKRIEDYINGLSLTDTEKDFLKSTFMNSDTYTSGRTIPTNEQIAQIISTAATNAATDINPYYKRFTAEELADLKNQMADIRGKAETFQQKQESSYKKVLAETKQNIRARGLTFSGTPLKSLGSEAAIRNISGIEGTIPEARRLGYEENIRALQQEARPLATAAERALGSEAVGALGSLSIPSDLSGRLGATTGLYTPTGGYSPTGTYVPTIEQQRLADIERAKQDRIARWRLTF